MAGNGSCIWETIQYYEIKGNFDEQYNTQLGIVKAKTAACMVMLVFTMIFELQISKIALTMRYISHGKDQ